MKYNCYRLFALNVIYFQHWKAVKKAMTKLEYEQACEISKLKEENQGLKIKIKDLEAEKKHWRTNWR